MNDPVNRIDPTGQLSIFSESSSSGNWGSGSWGREIEWGPSFQTVVIIHQPTPRHGPAPTPGGGRAEAQATTWEGKDICAIEGCGTGGSWNTEPSFPPPINPGDFARGGIKRAIKDIDPRAICDIERRVREGATDFALDTFTQLKRVAEGMAENVQRALRRGNVDRARDVAEKSKQLVDRLDRFKPLTPEARQELKDIIDEPLR